MKPTSPPGVIISDSEPVQMEFGGRDLPAWEMNMSYLEV